MTREEKEAEIKRLQERISQLRQEQAGDLFTKFFTTRRKRLIRICCVIAIFYLPIYTILKMIEVNEHLRANDIFMIGSNFSCFGLSVYLLALFTNNPFRN